MRVARLFLLALGLLLVTAASASARVGAFASTTAAITPAPAYSASDLAPYAGDNWLTVGGGLSDDRYSTLNQINTSNVANLKVAWHVHLGLPAIKTGFGVGQEANAVAVNGVLYVPSGVDQVFAIDGATGNKLWEYDATFTGGFVPTLAVSRGVAVGAG